MTHSCCTLSPTGKVQTVDTTVDSLLVGWSSCCNLSPDLSWPECRWCCGRKDSADGGLWVEWKKSEALGALWDVQAWTCGNLSGDTEVVVVVSWDPWDGRLWSRRSLAVTFSTDCCTMLLCTNTHLCFYSLTPSGSFIQEFQNSDVNMQDFFHPH